MSRYGSVLVVCAALGALPIEVGAATVSRQQARCSLGLAKAGALVARAELDRFLGCVDAVAAGAVAPGGAADCLAADPAGKIAAARARTARIAARRCRETPPFGLRAADRVNEGFAGLLRIGGVFGPGLERVVRRGADPAGARCQRAVARGMAALARAQLHVAGAELARVLRSRRDLVVADLQACLAADPAGRLARAARRHERRTAKACRGVDLAARFAGGCGGGAADAVLGCAGGEARCGACLALAAAGELGSECRAIAGTTPGTICAGPSEPPPSVARLWNEAMLAAIRLDFPRPPVHARNLFHLSAVMWDAWAAYDAGAQPYRHFERRASDDRVRDRAASISFAAYRLIRHRFALSPNAAATRRNLDDRMAALGYDPGYASTTDDTAAALGNRVAETLIAAALADGANEGLNYADPTYAPVNDPLVVKEPGAEMLDPNRWQPLALDVQIGQNGIPIPGNVQIFVGPQWESVTPFALTRATPTDGYLDPGLPPQVGGVGDQLFKARVLDMLRYASHLTIDDGVRIDISPASMGNSSLGTNDGEGYPLNPATGEPYAPHVVPRGDFARVLAEYWADGPTSETPPGHWNSIANAKVTDHPDLVRRIGGTGPELDPLEWDVKLYFALNGALHDAAVQCWGTKRRYDYVRPISMVRHLGGRGQSSDPMGPSYDPLGLPLEPGLVEVVTVESSAPGERHAHLAGHVGEIAVYSWPGQPADPKTQYAGVRWVRAVEWLPYQRNTFVTPPFAGFTSGHSTFSRSAAELLTRFTGSAYFPGGLGEFHVPANGLLQFEIGPSEPITLQWARYYDAADQAGLSRLYGGIHVATDDFGGRIAGAEIGAGAYAKALDYFAPPAP